PAGRCAGAQRVRGGRSGGRRRRRGPGRPAGDSLRRPPPDGAAVPGPARDHRSLLRDPGGRGAADRRRAARQEAVRVAAAHRVRSERPRGALPARAGGKPGRVTRGNVAPDVGRRRARSLAARLRRAACRAGADSERVRVMPTHFQIGVRRVGPGEPLFVIAEIGLNHGGSLDRALRLVDAAAAAGASAVKVQVLRAADLVAPGCPAPAHVRAPSLVEFFAQFELEESGYAAIADRARRRGLAFVATPFALGAVEMLERLAPDAYKIASGDITYDALIEACAGT